MTPLTVRIGPNDWELSYTFADFREAERRLKRDLLPGSQKSIAEWEAMTACEDLVVSIFIGICKKNPLVTLDQIEEHITDYDVMFDWQAKANEAMMRDTAAIRKRIEKLKAEAENPTPAT